VRGDGCARGAEIACNDDAPGCFTSEPNDHHGSRLALHVTAGATYYLVVDGYGGRAGAYPLSVVAPGTTPTAALTPVATATAPPAATATPPPSPGPTVAAGTCAQPIVLPAAGGSFGGTTTGGASTSGGRCATSGNAPERVFAWTPDASGLAELSTCDAGATRYDTVLYVRDGGCGSSDLVCNDDAPGCAAAGTGDHGSRVTLPVVAGRTYVIVVDGYNGRSGTFTLHVTPPRL
jgi:hypothetical protein